MLAGGFQQTLFAKFLSLAIQRFRNAIGVKHDSVAGSQLAFFHHAVPFLEQAHDRTSCPQPFKAVVAVQEQSRWMPAIRVTQLAGVIVVFREEEGCVVPVGGVFVKQLMYRPQELLGFFPSCRALAAQSRLEISHEQSGPDALASDIRDNQAEPATAEIEKVVIVSAYSAGRMANSCIGKRSNRRLSLRKQARLHLLGDG